MFRKYRNRSFINCFCGKQMAIDRNARHTDKQSPWLNFSRIMSQGANGWIHILLYNPLHIRQFFNNFPQCPVHRNLPGISFNDNYFITFPANLQMKKAGFTPAPELPCLVGFRLGVSEQNRFARSNGLGRSIFNRIFCRRILCNDVHSLRFYHAQLPDRNILYPLR